MTLHILVTNTDPCQTATLKVATRRPDGSPSPSWADVDLMGGECRLFRVHSAQHLVITTDEPQNAPIVTSAAAEGVATQSGPQPATTTQEDTAMTDDKTIEDAIQAKGLTALRVRPADIEANIIDEVYFTAEQGYQRANEDSGIPAGAFGTLRLLTFCVLVLRNGFTVTGESACVSPENFDPAIGRQIARQNAVSKVWPLMGYALRSAIAFSPADAVVAKTVDNWGIPAPVPAPEPSPAPPPTPMPTGG